ncbi:MAG: site-specific integrase, partial [Gammaproteobacteria bacterium]|nr:site-specific integrase [Gammaproteobacteria bacterium]
TNPDGDRRLTAVEFQQLVEIPPERVWLADIATNPNTRRAYKRDIDDFCNFVGLHRLEELRMVTSAHVVAWRTDIENRLIADGKDPDGNPVYRKPSGSMIRRKLASLSSLFDYLCEKQAMTSNPVRGLKRPKANNNEGMTQALGDAQVRALLSAPPADTLKGKRDRAILATLFFHALRRQELCDL